jgi:hypothetical protein
MEPLGDVQYLQHVPVQTHHKQKERRLQQPGGTQRGGDCLEVELNKQ